MRNTLGTKITKMTSKSKKKQLKRQWPRDMYLEDDSRRHDREYQDFRDSYQEELDAQGFNIFDRIAPNSGYKPVPESPQFLNISAPPAPFMIRHARRDAYEKSRARFESKPKLTAIPERGARGIAAAGRYPGTLTASEIAEVDSHFGHSRVSTESGNRENGSRRGIPMSDIKDENRSYVSGFDAPPSYKSADSNNNWWRRKNMSSRKMKICIGAIVALVLVGIVISVVAIYFSLIAMNDSEDNNTVRYEYTMRLDSVNFSSALLNNKSTEYSNLQKDICDTMQIIIDEVTLCELDACREGSIITDFTLGVPTKVRDEYKSSNSRKYSDFLMKTITQAWGNESPTIVETFVDKYGPNPQSLSLRRDLPATTTTTTTTIATTMESTSSASSTVLTIPQTTIPTTVLPSTTQAPVSTTQAQTSTSPTTSIPASTSTVENTPTSTAAPSTEALSTDAPSTGATSTDAPTADTTLSTSVPVDTSSALLSTNALTSEAQGTTTISTGASTGVDTPTVDPTSTSVSTPAPTQDPTDSNDSIESTTLDMTSTNTIVVTT